MAIPSIIFHLNSNDENILCAFRKSILLSWLFIIPFFPILQDGPNNEGYLITMAWFFFVPVVILGLVTSIFNYFFIKDKVTKEYIPSFIYSLGITAGYAFLYYIFYGILIVMLEGIYDNEKIHIKRIGFIKKENLPSIVTLYEYPFACYLIDLILYLGHFFNNFALTIILKYELSKYYIIILIIFQTVLYPLHMTYIFNYVLILIIVVILLSIIEIIFGIMIYRKYEKDKIDEKDINENTSISGTKLNDINNDNNSIMASS